MNSRCRDHHRHSPAALLTFGQRLVRDFLKGFSVRFALLALVLVNRHILDYTGQIGGRQSVVIIAGFPLPIADLVFDFRSLAFGVPFLV